MPWKISYLENQKIIRTEYTDPFMPEDFLKVIAENISIAKEKQTNLFLADCTDLTRSGNVIDIYQLGNMLQAMNAEIHIKEAIVVMKQKGNVVSDLQFFETVANNRLINVRLFFDLETALAWLVG
ncbi:MAG: hypothetical protein IPG80_01760 [Anaerolineales bacterium]|uniref:hypothetical protein n=1 Tax=Candidatus Villigracilis vicinus TaxID=3140679 RepID=UPI0031369F9B|nr:hypothetical protein [Anaerolineales bacterium]